MLVDKEVPGRGFQRKQGLTMHRAGYMSFRTLCAVLSVTFLLAYGAMLAYGTGAKAEPEGAAPPEAAQAQSDSGSDQGHGTNPDGGPTGTQGAGTESAPGDDSTDSPDNAQTQAPSGDQTAPGQNAGDQKAEEQNAVEPKAPEQKAEDQPLKDDRGNAMGPDVSNEESGSKVLVTIDKSTQHMSVFVDGIEQYSWPVSTGKAGYSTPSGTFTATSMNEIWYSKQWDNAPMPHAVFFDKKGHAIHGTLEEKNLGKAASHGCVRLSRANATTLFNLVKEKGLKNTQVVLTGETPGGEYKVADQPRGQQYGDVPPWFAPGQGYYPQPRRRGLFGRWFQPPPQAYYPPRGYYYQPRRGY
jgi:lipoprotein-anchoring transpeptidase ErfK/SrfK